MALRIDPRFRVLWRDPQTAQFGADPAALVIPIAAGWQEHVLHAVRIGTTRAALNTVVGGDCSAAELDAFLTKLSPTFDTDDAVQGVTVGVEGSGALASAIAALAHRLDMLRDCDSGPDIVILAGQHLLTPMRLIRWSGQRRLLLPALAGDTAVRIGPLLGVPGGPCPNCITLHRRDQDAAWPMLAAQLIDQDAAAETDTLLIAEAAAATLRLVLHAAARPADAPAGTPGPAATRQHELSLTRSGERVATAFAAHPDCGCVRLESLDAALLDESASATTLLA